MNELKRVGNMIQSGQLDALKKDYPQINENSISITAHYDGTSHFVETDDPDCVLSGYFIPDPGGQWQLGVTSQTGAAVSQFPANWSDLSNAMAYSWQNYGATGSVCPGLITVNPRVVGSSIFISTDVLGVPGGEANLVENLIHEPQHDYSQRGMGHDWNGLKNVVTCQETYSLYSHTPLPGSNPGGQSAYAAYLGFLQAVSTQDGSNLWNKILLKVGPAPKTPAFMK